MKTIAAAAAASLLLSAGVLPAPASATASASAASAASASTAAAASSDRVKNCAQKRYGVEVRVKMRDNGRFTRVRVSHPDGRGNFREPRVRRVLGTVGVFSGGKNKLHALRKLRPSFHTASAAGGAEVVVFAAFKVRKHTSIRLACALD